MRVLRLRVVDLRVRAEFVKAARREEGFGVRYKLRARSLPSKLRFDPNALEKGDRSAVASVGVRADRDLGKADGVRMRGFHDEAPSFAAAQKFIDLPRVNGCTFFRPESAAHLCPRRPVGDPRSP